MRTLMNNEIKVINGGHGHEITTFGIIMLLIELPHALHGMIELFNYSWEWKLKGCAEIEEGDHFKEKICYLFS
ncbi:MAG: hypothetical protein U1E78_11090 [Gammaproteobacteria bacterium]